MTVPAESAVFRLHEETLIPAIRAKERAAESDHVLWGNVEIVHTF